MIHGHSRTGRCAAGLSRRPSVRASPGPSGARLREAVIPDWLTEAVRPRPAPVSWEAIVRAALAVCVPLSVGFMLGRREPRLLLAIAADTFSLIRTQEVRRPGSGCTAEDPEESARVFLLGAGADAEHLVQSGQLENPGHHRARADERQQAAVGA